MRTRGLIAAALLLGGHATSALAQEYCVTCNGPDAVYRCVPGGSPGVVPPHSRAQLLCITELARSGGHASCSVGRQTAEECPGEVRTVFFPSADPAAPLPYETAQPPMPETGALSAAEGEPEPELPPSEQPSTAAKIAKQTVDASNAGLKKAGEAVSSTAESAGNVVKKTWTCVSSLFSDC